MPVRKKSWLIVSFYAILLHAAAQPSGIHPLIAGPMLGQVELRTASIWLEVSPEIRSVSLTYWKQQEPAKRYTRKYAGILGNDFNPVKFELGGLDFNNTYQYQINLDGKPTGSTASFITKDLWQWRKPAPDFSFLTGSCAYFNEAIYDRPGKPYGGDSSIFETMAATPGSFMVWLGDNWYTREADHFSAWGLWYRASHDRSLKILQPFWKAMPHYAIWDDHDYGPDNSDGSYILKDQSREVFMHYWCNPSYGENGKGIYTMVSYADVDLFLTDDRYFRSADEILDSVLGKPNPEKHFFGKSQLAWLENALVNSIATFKIIAVGSQVLNPINDDFECLHHYSAEYNELMNFLGTQKISGVLFLSGDRHHSEIIRTNRPGNYPLYDITVSPFTSGIARVKGIEINSPARVAGTLVEEQNFSKISFSGEKGNRTMTVTFIGLRGIQKASWKLSEKELFLPPKHLQ
jgi:alkaline phosphatase D